MKAILISGSFKKLEIPQEVIKFIKKNTKENNNITYIADNFDKYENNDKFVLKLNKAFEEKEYKFNNINIIDSRKTKEEMIKNIKLSNIIFILGGNTLKQIKNINDYNLKEYICNDNKIVIGISAGAINMAKKVVLAKDINDDIPELSLYDGVGLVDINIEPHCDFEDEEHWENLKEASFINEILIMHDDAYIIIDNDKEEYYGTYCKLNKGIVYYKDKKTTKEQFLKEINYTK